MTNSHGPWSRLLVEGVVIVASVLLALGADAWRQERQDRREEQALLRGLRSEFLENTDQLDRRISEHQRLADVNAALLALLWETNEPSIVVPDTLLYGLTVLSTYDATLGTFEEARGETKTPPCARFC